MSREIFTNLYRVFLGGMLFGLYRFTKTSTPWISDVARSKSGLKPASCPFGRVLHGLPGCFALAFQESEEIFDIRSPEKVRHKKYLFSMGVDIEQRL